MGFFLLRGNLPRFFCVIKDKFRFILHLSLKSVGASIARPRGFVSQNRIAIRRSSVISFGNPTIAGQLLADVLQSAADILISMLAGGKHTMIYQWPPLQRAEITDRQIGIWRILAAGGILTGFSPCVTICYNQ